MNKDKEQKQIEAKLSAEDRLHKKRLVLPKYGANEVE